MKLLLLLSLVALALSQDGEQIAGIVFDAKSISLPYIHRGQG